MILVGFLLRLSDDLFSYFCFGRFRQRLNPLDSLSKSKTPLEDMEKSLKSKYLTRTYIKTNHAK